MHRKLVLDLFRGGCVFFFLDPFSPPTFLFGESNPFNFCSALEALALMMHSLLSTSEWAASSLKLHLQDVPSANEMRDSQRLLAWETLG